MQVPLQHSQSVSQISPSGRHTGLAASHSGLPAFLHRSTPNPSASQIPEQQSHPSRQISPYSLSAAWLVTMLPETRQPPVGKHLLKPSASGSHLNEQQSRSSVPHGS
jgi:hypothetical protein